MSSSLGSWRSKELQALQVSIFNQLSFSQELWEQGVSAGVYQVPTAQPDELSLSEHGSHIQYRPDGWSMMAAVHVSETVDNTPFLECLRPMNQPQVCPHVLDAAAQLTVGAVPFLLKHVHDICPYLMALKVARGDHDIDVADSFSSSWQPFLNSSSPVNRRVSSSIIPLLGDGSDTIPFIAPAVQIVSVHRYHSTTQAIDLICSAITSSPFDMAVKCFPTFPFSNQKVDDGRKERFQYDVCISDGASTITMVQHPALNHQIRSGHQSTGTVVNVIQTQHVQDPADHSKKVPILNDLLIKRIICPTIVRRRAEDHSVHSVPYDALKQPALPLLRDVQVPMIGKGLQTRSPYYTAVTSIHHDPACVYRPKFSAIGNEQVPHTGMYFLLHCSNRPFHLGLLSCELLLPMFGEDCVVPLQLPQHSPWDWETAQRVHRLCLAARRRRIHTPTLRMCAPERKDLFMAQDSLETQTLDDFLNLCPLSQVLTDKTAAGVYVGRVVSVSRLQSYAENASGGYNAANSAYSDKQTSNDDYTRPAISAGPEAVFSGAARGVHKNPYMIEMFIKDRVDVLKVSVWGVRAVQLVTEQQVGSVVALRHPIVQTRREAIDIPGQRKKYREIVREQSVRNGVGEIHILPANLASTLTPTSNVPRQQAVIATVQQKMKAADIALLPFTVYLTSFDALCRDTTPGSAVNVCGIVTWVGPLQLKKVYDKVRDRYYLQRWFSIAMPSLGDMYGPHPSVPVCLFSNNETANLCNIRIGQPIVLDQVQFCEYYRSDTIRSFYLRGGHQSHLLLPLQIALSPLYSKSELLLTTLQLVHSFDPLRSKEEQVLAQLLQYSHMYEISSNAVHDEAKDILSSGDQVTHMLHFFHTNVSIPTPTHTQYSSFHSVSTLLELPQLEIFQQVNNSSLTQMRLSTIVSEMRASRLYEVRHYGLISAFNALIPAVQGQQPWSQEQHSVGYDHISMITSAEPLYLFTAYVLSDIQACLTTVDSSSLFLHIITPHPHNLQTNAVLVSLPSHEKLTVPLRLTSSGPRNGEHIMSGTLQSKLIARSNVTGSFSDVVPVKSISICLADQFSRVDKSFLTDLAIESIFTRGADVRDAYVAIREQRKSALRAHTLSELDLQATTKAVYILDHASELEPQSRTFLDALQANEMFVGQIDELGAATEMLAKYGVHAQDVIDLQQRTNAVPPYWRGSHKLPLSLSLPLRDFKYVCTPGALFDSRIDLLVSELAFNYGCLVEFNRILQASTYEHKMMVSSYKYLPLLPEVPVPATRLNVFDTSSNEYSANFETAWNCLLSYKSIDLVDGCALTFESTYHSRDEAIQESSVRPQDPLYHGIISVPLEE